MNTNRFYILIPPPVLNDLLIIICTFIFFYLIDIKTAVGITVIITCLLLFRRANVNNIETCSETEDAVFMGNIIAPKEVEIFEMRSGLMTMSLYRFVETMRSMHNHPKILIIRMRFVKTIDESDIHALKEISKQLMDDNTRLLFSSVNSKIQRLFESSGITEKIGKENILNDINNALSRSKVILNIK